MPYRLRQQQQQQQQQATRSTASDDTSPELHHWSAADDAGCDATHSGSFVATGRCRDIRPRCEASPRRGVTGAAAEGLRALLRARRRLPMRWQTQKG